MVVNPLIWVLGTELGFSAGVASTLYCLPISPASKTDSGMCSSLTLPKILLIPHPE